MMTLDGRHSLLSLASEVVHSLHSHYEQQHQMAVTVANVHVTGSELDYIHPIVITKLLLYDLLVSLFQ
jgi:hypothetical protein